MIRIVWQNKFSVGNEKIDSEHRTFVELIKTLSESIENDKPMPVIERQIQELGLYAQFHFFSEETLMLEHDFPGYKQHKSAHEHLLQTFNKRVEEFRREPRTGMDIILFLFGWFAEHTTDVDQELADFLGD